MEPEGHVMCLPFFFFFYQDDGSATLLREHLYLLLPCAAETLGRSAKLLRESSLDKQIIKKLHCKNA